MGEAQKDENLVLEIERKPFGQARAVFPEASFARFRMHAPIVSLSCCPQGPLALG